MGLGQGEARIAVFVPWRPNESQVSSSSGMGLRRSQKFLSGEGRSSSRSRLQIASAHTTKLPQVCLEQLAKETTGCMDALENTQAGQST